jgi:hypothetical protein
LGDAPRNLIPGDADLLDRAIVRVGEIPVQVALAGNVRALVAAAHSDHDVRLFGELGREWLGQAVDEVDPDLAHDLYDDRVYALTWCGPGGQGGMRTARGVLEQSLTHL